MAGLARLGDKAKAEEDSHGCPRCSHTVVGPAVTGSSTVKINGKPALRKGDQGEHASCCGSNTWIAVGCSSSVFIDGLPAVRMGDETRHCGGVGMMIEGSGDITNGG